MFSPEKKQRNIGAFKDVLNGSTFAKAGEKISVSTERVRQFTVKIARRLHRRNYGIVDYSKTEANEYYYSISFLRRNKDLLLIELEKYLKEVA